MGATDELVDEHRLIVRVIGALDRRLREGEQTGHAPVAFLRDLLTFSRGFIDRCHHGKEEGCLFPCLERRGIPAAGGIVAVLLEEHETGRRLIARIGELLDRYESGAATAAAVFDPCRSYADLLRAHILKEDDLLFPAADAAMDTADRSAVAACFGEREEVLGIDRHHELHRLAEEMAAP